MFWLGFFFGALACAMFICICVALSSKGSLSHYDKDFLMKFNDSKHARDYFNNPVVEYMRRTDHKR